jgi:hypothetical protein
MIDYPCFIKLLKRSVFQGPVILHGLDEADMPASRDMIADLLIKG